MSKQVRISYKTRDLGQGTYEGECDAYVLAEVDTWGKRTIIVERPGGKLEKWYLFEDEYTILTEQGLTR